MIEGERIETCVCSMRYCGKEDKTMSYYLTYSLEIRFQYKLGPRMEPAGVLGHLECQQTCYLNKEVNQ